MDKFIRDWMIKNWDSNWHDSRCFEDELERLKIFTKAIIEEWLRRFSKEIEKED